MSTETLSESREKLTKLLRQLFQFDLADLDFGIYRVMNYKRKEMERFIENDLIQTTERELEALSRTSEEVLKEKLRTLAASINEDFGAGTIDDEGEARRLRDAPKVREYLRMREEARKVEQERLSAEDVYNRVYEFF